MKNLFALLFVFVAGYASAQDKIYKTNDDVIECKVIEVNEENIIYKQNDKENAASITISRIDVVKVVFGDGSVMQIKPEETNEELYLNNRKHAVKFDFLSPLFGHTAIGYERSIQPGMSHEGLLGFIGLGLDNDANTGSSNRFGLYAKYGVKFLSPRTSIFSNNKRFKHLLDGSYIKPEIYVGAFQADVSYSQIQNPNQFPPVVDYGTTKASYTYGGLQLVAGVQKVYSDRFLFEYYFGIGYGFLNENYKDLPSNANTIEYGGRKTFGVLANPATQLSFSGGIKLGVLLN